jgi:acetaldehyde dehydrogenase (acetylating)
MFQYATDRKVAGSIPDKVIFSIYLILPAALGPGVYLASNRNENQKSNNNNNNNVIIIMIIIMFPGSKVRRVHRADNLTSVSRLSR